MDCILKQLWRIIKINRGPRQVTHDSGVALH